MAPKFLQGPELIRENTYTPNGKNSFWQSGCLKQKCWSLSLAIWCQNYCWQWPCIFPKSFLKGLQNEDIPGRVQHLKGFMIYVPPPPPPFFSYCILSSIYTKASPTDTQHWNDVDPTLIQQSMLNLCVPAGITPVWLDYNLRGLTSHITGPSEWMSLDVSPVKILILRGIVLQQWTACLGGSVEWASSWWSDCWPRWLSWMGADWWSGCCRYDPHRVGNILSWRLIMKHSLPSADSWRAVSGERICILLVNHLQD